MEERERADHKTALDEHGRYRVKRRSAPPDLEPPEILHGGKPGSRFGRRVRAGDRLFEPTGGEGTYTATERATAPRTGAGRAWRTVRRIAVGSPISSDHSAEQRLPKWKALAVFSSDNLSSSAYATDELLLVLIAAGTGALVVSIPLAAAISFLLAVLVLSYRQTIRAYPNGGGAYIVARENLGDGAGMTAASALLVDYVLTVSVSVAAGVLAVVSAFPEVRQFHVLTAVVAVAVITLLNLRGVKESGTIFAIPTYGFIFAFAVLLIGGFVRVIVDPGLRASEPPGGWVEGGAVGLSWFLILRAFASGSTAVTGVEAISNGIPAFKKPEAQNAAATLAIMAFILGILFTGITLLANQLGVRHAGEMSVPAQIARTVYGDSAVFYGIQVFTALILFLAANTAYADFPRLSSILARDRFLPHHFLFRGDRLAFSNGVLVLGITSSLLLVVFDASVNRLIQLYVFGVFVSFTFSQAGMVTHWLRLREPGWRRGILVNGVGGAVTALVAAIVGVTKFSHGAWISMLAIALLAMTLWLIHRHYERTDRALRVSGGHSVRPPESGRRRRPIVVIPVDDVNRMTIRAAVYGKMLSAGATALHVTDDLEQGQTLQRRWETSVLDVPLVVIRSPFRSFVGPVVSYIDVLRLQEPGSFVTVVLPEVKAPWLWSWLHNQTSRRLRSALLDRDGTAVVVVPYRLQ